MELKLSSGAFANGAPMPAKHTGDGLNVSPSLAWTEPPPATVGFVLIVDDPDAPGGNWVHWVLYDVPGRVRSLGEDIPKKDLVLGAAKQGRNDFHQVGYDGPAPPPGRPHRYIFPLFAIDALTGLPPGATKRDVVKKIQGHVLATAKVTATYRR